MPERKDERTLGYEVRDLPPRAIVIFGMIILLTIAGAILLARWYYSALDSRFLARDRPPSPLAEPDTRPPEPRLQVTPQLELDEVRTRDRARLSGYRWIDRSQGTVQIPIERAIDLIAERGIPASQATPSRENSQ